MPSPVKKPLLRFLLLLSAFIGFGLILRLLYHTIPGGITFVSHSWFIDTFYRLLIGPVHFLLTLTGVAHTIGYTHQIAQYFIHLHDANVTIYLWIPCLGISIMYVYASLILAFPNPRKKKLVFIFCGILAIQFLNILRLFALTAIIAHTHTTETQSAKMPWLAVNHETIFNLGMIFLIFLMFVLFARKSQHSSGN